MSNFTPAEERAMTEKIPVGVVGVGHLGSLHAKFLASLPGSHLVGVSDIDKARADAVALECSTTSFTSADDLMEKVRAVSIATPTAAHFDIARKAMSRGLHVFIEKPITRTTSDAESLVRLARERGLIAQVGHIERFNPAILALESYLVEPLFVESHRLAQFNARGTDVAVVLDLMIHDIDIILSLVKSPVESIEANGVPVVSDTIDIANARLQFSNGCVANVTASRISQKKMRKMRLFQRDAYISIDFSDGVAEVFRLADAGSHSSSMTLGEIALARGRKKILYEQPPVKDVDALQHELSMFIESVRTGKPPVVSAEDGTRALRVANEIMRKISEQKFSV